MGKREYNSIQSEGNYYDKYGSRNPIVRRLMKSFFNAMDEILKVSENWCGGYVLKRDAVREM